jgi:hypothetical protein
VTGLERFVLEHRVRMRHDTCGDPVVLGKLGHIGEHGYCS